MNFTILGSGFIGKNLILELAKTNKVHVISRSLNLKAINNNIRHTKIDLKVDNFDYNLFHDTDILINVLSLSTPGSNSNEILSMELELFAKILDQIKISGIKKYVFVSSASIYGDNGPSLVSEETNALPNTNYGKSRLKMEETIKDKLKFSMVSYLLLRISNPYGPHQIKQGIISKLIYSAIFKRNLIVNNNGNTIRDYIYIDDLVKKIVLISERVNLYDTYNLSTSNGQSTNDIIKKLKFHFPKILDFVNFDESIELTNYSVLNNSRFVEEYGHYQYTEMNIGLSLTIKWYMSSLTD